MSISYLIHYGFTYKLAPMKRYLILITIGVMLRVEGQQIGNPLDGIEIGRLEYGYISGIGDVQIERKGIGFNFGKPLKKGQSGIGVGYNNFHLTFKDASEFNNFSSFDHIHNIRLSLFYRRPLKNNWSFSLGISPLISSTLNDNISGEDIVYTSFTSVSKRWLKDGNISVLNLGIGFGTLFGRPSVFPVISYFKQVSEAFSYALGLPQTGAFFTLNDKNRIDITARPEGLFGNNATELAFDDGNATRINTKLQYNALRLNVTYNLKFGANWTTFFTAGYIPFSTLKVVDDDNNDLYDFNADDSAFFNVGIRFNINRKSNESEK
ncbi:MAG: DUF6268 family outer membrane beta-barrel protein [Bacteroidota bacterium]